MKETTETTTKQTNVARVEVCRDAISRLLSGHFDACHSLLSVEDWSTPFNNADDFIKSQKCCEVCAKGALLLSSIIKYNSVSTAELKSVTLKSHGRMVAAMELKVIKDIFPQVFLDVIEILYERNEDRMWLEHINTVSSDCYFALVKYAKEHFSEVDKFRLIEILQSIVDNNGEVPPQWPIFLQLDD